MMSRLPREVTGMMYGVYHDWWWLRPFMRDIMRVIRVEGSEYRRETPERPPRGSGPTA